MRRSGRLPAHGPRRSLLALAAAPAAVALLTAAASDPSPSPSPAPSPTPVLQGTLQVDKTDPSGAPLAVPGARFNVHRATSNGPVVTVMATDSAGTAAKKLEAATYCLEETAAPPGFQVAPTYTPGQCMPVLPDRTTVVTVADPPAATPTPTPQPTPTPTPTPIQTGELQIVKVDTSGQTIGTPGFTFNIHVGSAKGQVIATITTDGSGTAIAGALNPATYCVEEVSAPDGYQVAPTYAPSNCVSVAPDPSQGRSPTTVTVTDPAATTPTPSEAAAGVPSASPSPGASAGPTRTHGPAGLPVAALARGLVGLGVLLLVAGGALIALAIRRRRMRPPELPPDVWYDSTIT